MHKTSDRTARFQKMAAERILTDTRLRGSLDDALANQLLGWGVEQLNQAALQTEGLDDAVAEDLFDQQMSAVTRLLRHASKLADPANLGEAEEEAWLLQSFQSSWEEWQQRPLGPMLVQQIAGSLHTADSHIILSQLMAVLDPPPTTAVSRTVMDEVDLAMEQEEE